MPTDFAGYETVIGASKGKKDFEYFHCDSFLPGTSGLMFTLGNTGAGSIMLIRLSFTPFSMKAWDWMIAELGAGNMSARTPYPHRCA